MAPRKPIKKTVKEDTFAPPKNEFIPENKPKKEKKKTSTENEVHVFDAIKKFISDERTHFVTGIVFLIIALFMVIAFISYIFNGAADQSKMELSFGELFSRRSEVSNWTSIIGAILAHSFIHKGFGVASFVFCIFITFLGLRMLKVMKQSVWKLFFQCSFWLIWTSITIGFVVHPFVKEWLHFLPGGGHGEQMSQLLISLIGIPGTIITIASSLLIFSIIVSSKTIPFLKNIFRKKDKDIDISENEAAAANNNEYSYDANSDFDENGPTVAVGTEIVPEEWVVKAASDDEIEFKIEPLNNIDERLDVEDTDTKLNDVADNENDNIQLEIENTEPPEVLGNNELNSDPHYNIVNLGKYDPKLDLTHYVYPTLDMLKVYDTDKDSQIDMVEQNANKNRIISTLQNYGIEIVTIKATVGPTITLYEIVPKAGVRISKIRNLEYDIMLSLAATGIRIIAPIPGKGTIGIEVPNADPQVVSMHSVIASKKFQESKFELPVAFGRTITNEIFMVDLAKMPHLLVAGATGQGKSVGLNAIISSLLYKKHPAELKLVLVDPKKVEFNIYGDIEKHFLAKLPDGEDAIITDTSKVVETLNSLCKEMDDRYDLLKKAHVRNLKEYNEKFTNRQLNPEKGHKFLPYIVVIVDEFGDLIMTAGKEVEMPIARIAQLARAVGIHMIIATQRPSVNIITGVIKANFPARVAFRVSSMIDSRTILDAPGANQLVGRGDMLFSQGNDLIRVQCAFVDTPEVENIVHHISKQQAYPSAFYLPEYVGPEGEGIDMSSVDMSKRDPLFEEAARMIVASQQGSTSLIQRKFSIGYNRAGRIVDQLEVAGIIGPFEGSKARQVLVMDDYHLEQILKNL